ncbi:Tex family protein [Myroides sp. JBRI-B21084]|uniref:Tex family protein n=1 Tax=Myroides sp. JBRI-B21084 TaxID=3119977 RepID=UPI0026E1684E|nr:Tex family protein [Paenimyroides cloacae]WKW46005.1 Tex family protein [Paenimyroides cloacae]
MNIVQYIKEKVTVSDKSIQNTLELFAQDCTIPFIARYRKDATGNLDEVQIEQIFKLSNQFEAIVKRKEAVLASIEEQGQLNDILKEKISQSFDLVEIEDLYLPFKKKRKTKADVAREAGLEPLAKIIMSQNVSDLEFTAEKYLNSKVFSAEDALQGARDIIAEWVNENIYVRKALRRKFQRQAEISTKIIKAKKDDEGAQKFHQYFDWNEPLFKAPAHRLLAMLRATNEGYVKLNVSIDKTEATTFIEDTVIKNKKHETAEQIAKAIADAYKRLLEPALANEVLQEYKLKADLQSIGVFSENLTQLLLSAPLGEKRVMGIDPGFKTGCKVVCIDENGNLLYNETIFPHAPQKDIAMATKKVRSMANSYKIDAVAIGNGTASRETEFFIKKVAFDKPVQVFVVSEAGASVYSASKIARDEFPTYDVTVRGAVSIGRRLQDPLAELVKIDPKSIGVGQYQHDVDQTLLKNELDQVVVRSVNKVGINLNTASKALLSYVSGIGEKLAENIVNYRAENGAFINRNDLKNVPRLGDKAYQQAAAFVRIVNGNFVLDNSAVHPEAYGLVEKIAKDLKVNTNDLIGNKALIDKIDIQKYISDKFGVHYITDLLKELEKPGLDPRKLTKVLEFDAQLKTIDQVVIGKVYNGIINNITNFGCFVDIGIKESGLVHISQVKAEFVSDINQVVKLHQHVQVKVLEVDLQKKRLQLTMIL